MRSCKMGEDYENGSIKRVGGQDGRVMGIVVLKGILPFIDVCYT